MHDCPWFKLYVVDVLMATEGMNNAARGEYFSGMIKAWATNDYSGYPFLKTQVEEYQELRKKKSAAGKLGAEATNNLRKLSTSYPHSKGEGCISAPTPANSAEQTTQEHARHVPTSAEHLPECVEQTPAHGQQKPTESGICSTKTGTLSISLSFFLSFFLKRREECREEKGLSVQKGQGGKYTLLDHFRSLEAGSMPFAKDWVVVASELVEKAVDPLAAAITKLRAGQQVITDSDLAYWLEDAELCISNRPEDRDADKLGQLITEVFAIPPSTGNGFSWAQHIHSMADIRRLWSQGKIYIGMASKAAVRRAAKASRSADETASQARKDLSAILKESSFKGTLTEAISEYLTDINKPATEKNISELLTSETKSNLFRLWLTENFIRAPQQKQQQPTQIQQQAPAEIITLLATRFTNTVAIDRIAPRVSDISPAALSTLLAALPQDAPEEELENSLMLKLYFP